MPPFVPLPVILDAALRIELSTDFESRETLDAASTAKTTARAYSVVFMVLSSLRLPSLDHRRPFPKYIRLMKGNLPHS